MTRPPKGDHNDATEHALSTEQASRQFWYLKFNGPRANPILQSIHIGGCTLGGAEIMVFARFGNFSCEYPLELRFAQLIFLRFFEALYCTSFIYPHHICSVMTLLLLKNFTTGLYSGVLLPGIYS